MGAAAAVMESGWLHRYGETLGDFSEVSLLEEEFAALVSRRFAVAMNSCGSTMFLALKCSGVEPGDKVLMNAFTLAPVPGAVAHAGAEHVLVEITPDLVIDLDDLERKTAESGARHLLLSHMRGHIADMDRLMTIADRYGIAVIEDCAHTMGASWAGRPTGAFGAVGCFSLQAYKHVNAGEGGILVTDDEDIAARAILYSGSYMLYGQHRSKPSEEAFARWKEVTPNFSLRMSNLTAALARPQLALLPERARVWNASYERLARGLARLSGLSLPHRPQQESYVQSSLQFSVAGLTEERFLDFLGRCEARGVYVKWFGSREAKGYTSVSGHWRYVQAPHVLPKTADVLERLCDVRIPLILTPEDCELVVAIIGDELVAVRGPVASPA
jgi:dTDP-4-amino-4,6-dideoxygalactose transaminase